MAGQFFFFLLIYPIRLLIETIFTLFYEMIGSLGYSIVAVSIVISVLVLPLYLRSDAVREEERRQKEALEGWEKHIRKTFHGEERSMMLFHYYRQQGYRPWYALRGTISLLLQIPFFIAAYGFLSELDLLQGAPFHIIRDLGAPDGLLTIGGVPVNVLPVLMTAVNVISGMIYAKKAPLSEKAQIYGIALIFLVLLYDSPAGLVMYWTMNNVFSLGKNIVLKTKAPERLAAVLSALAGIFFFGYMWLRGKLYEPQITAFSVLIMIVCLLPAAVWMIKRNRKTGVDRETAKEADGEEETASGEKPDPVSRLQFFLTALGFTGLVGALIPLTVISSSPADFMPLGREDDPLALAGSMFLAAAGVFLVWNGVAWYLLKEKDKKSWTKGFTLLFFLAVAGYYTQPATGMLSELLELFSYGKATPAEIGINLLILAACLAAGLILYRIRGGRMVRYLTILLLIAIYFMSAGHVIRTNRIIAELPEEQSADGPVFHLSRDGKNVAVIMLDRAVGRYVPYIFREKPELTDAFSGFTYYPDTMSFAKFTNFGMPAIFGGYDYTPARTNARPELSLVEKHNEALKLMPTLFSEAGYEVEFLNPFYAGYKEVPVLSIFDDIPGMKAYHEDARFLPAYGDSREAYDNAQRHNMFFFSLMRILPLACRDWIYDSGDYRGTLRFLKGTMRTEFLLHYSWLDHLAEVTEITQDDGDHLLLMDNQTMHDTENLRLPDYVPAPYVDNEEYIEQWELVREGLLIRGDPDTDKGYECNVAGYLMLAKWFAYLKENGVYDNTRIILVADHGDSDPRLTDTELDNGLDALAFNPLLMVKDFGASGPMVTDDSYMTNADVPSLAMEGLIEDPVNPFTGNPVVMEKDGPQTVTASIKCRLEEQTKGNVFDTSDAPWYEVTPGDIYDSANWKEIVP